MSNGYNFTESVRHALAQARAEAAQFQHEYIGTEHMLLALTAVGPNAATHVIEASRVPPASLRDVIEQTVLKGRGPARPDPSLPFTSRAKKVLELAMAEASELGHDYVGTQHLLLGLIREEKGLAAQVLVDAGITLAMAREHVRRMHVEGITDGDVGDRPYVPPPAPPSAMTGFKLSAVFRLLLSNPQVAAVFTKHGVDGESVLADLENLD